ncbi:hypothetical protein TELCIR_00125 [Teladorsagia circumcincta]|uniref:Uncharacterized protein n=1 Tax=Teladorsagia circumcincta TaxID=45464 RepID=A0A2G9V5F6_TELCI|nr:hypothetical protein TELCIR_00125 [Teladorsagia circumcincta]
MLREPRFLFEAPPPYEGHAAVPPGQRRMVAIKLTDLPVTQPSKEFDKAIKGTEDGESKNAMIDIATQESVKEQRSKELASKEPGSKEADSKELGSSELATKEQGSEDPAVKEVTAASNTRRRSRSSKKKTPTHTPQLSQTQNTDKENMH